MNKDEQLKLYIVDIENTVMVLAENSQDAEVVASKLDSSELDSQDAQYHARLITKVNQIDSYFADSMPYTFKRIEKDPINKELLHLTCKEIAQIYEDKQKVLKDKAEADKLQVKFNF